MLRRRVFIEAARVHEAMIHPDEQEISAYVAGVGGEAERRRIKGHITECRACRKLAAEYGEMVAALRDWRVPPTDKLRTGRQAVVQRVRLRRLLGELFLDPSLRRQAAEVPEALLASHGITPAPQLLAAFRELALESQRSVPPELDSRISEVLALID